MKGIFNLFFHLFVVLQTVYGQEKTRVDIGYIDRLLVHANDIQQLKIDSAIIMAERAIKLADGINYKKGAGEAWYQLGFYMDRKGRYEKGIECYKNSLKLKREIGDSSVCLVMGEIGYCYNCLGKTEDALYYFRMAVDTAKKYGKNQAVSMNANRIGQIYRERGILDQALSQYEEGLSYARKNSVMDTFNILTGLHDIGSLHFLMGNAEKAAIYGNQFMALARNYSDKRFLVMAYMIQGLMSREKKDYEKAKESYLKALEVNEQISDKLNRGGIFALLGDIGMETRQFNEAMKQYQNAYRADLELNLKSSVSADLIKIGTVHMAVKDYTRAVQNGLQGFMIADSIQNVFLKKDASELLWKAYQAMNDCRNALTYLELFKIYQDSIMSKDFGKRLVEKEMLFRIEADSIRHAREQEMIIAGQKQKDLRQAFIRNGILAGLLGALVFLGVLYRQRNRISKEKKRSDDLLLNILPSEVAEEIKSEGRSRPRTFSMVSVMFTDFKDFTAVSEKVSAELLVAEIDHCFSAFDKIIQKHKVEKIKTVGDAYICAGGMPTLNITHPVDIINAAIEIRDYMIERKKEQDNCGGFSFELRLGIHTGPVVAGIVGVKKYAYDIWGDTVNIAARMEQNSEAGKINISGNTYKLVRDKFSCTYRGQIEAKNKGMIDMYFVGA